MSLKKCMLVTVALSSVQGVAQTISREPVEVLYGNRVYSGEHQVVHNTPEKVTIIPAEQAKHAVLANMVVSAHPNRLSYLEESAISLYQDPQSHALMRQSLAPF